MVKHFQYTPPVIEALERTMSRERLSTYLASTAGNAEKALCLYSWNVDISGALYAPLQGLEIALRNGLHDALSAVYSDFWYTNDRIPLENYAIGDIRKAENILIRRNTAVVPPNMVAELSFGFWVSLLGGAYHNSLWTPVLHRAFPHLGNTKHKAVYYTFNQLRKLRNRIAHHEPIFSRHLFADYESIITAINWICPEMAVWVDSNNTFCKVWEERPI